ncbi:hypothetical protein PCL_00711 [Purpureocillium lilacinum]|uniref:Uncharacterized protein n=1 Tax=Purpureocillium lilacinum TaxID=33203 RepID=A0A2U3E5N5_PURLI|nr:hypothetical protein PCL_00711 [Purpureocillium lilacinum]
MRYERDDGQQWQWPAAAMAERVRPLDPAIVAPTAIPTTTPASRADTGLRESHSATSHVPRASLSSQTDKTDPNGRPTLGFGDRGCIEKKRAGGRRLDGGPPTPPFRPLAAGGTARHGADLDTDWRATLTPPRSCCGCRLVKPGVMVVRFASVGSAAVHTTTTTTTDMKHAGQGGVLFHQCGHTQLGRSTAPVHVTRHAFPRHKSPNDMSKYCTYVRRPHATERARALHPSDRAGVLAGQHHEFSDGWGACP